MVNVNGTEMPLEEQSGLLVLEDPSGHQRWALIVDAVIAYGDAEFVGDEMPEMKVIATMKPGELLRMATTEEAGEENVLVYSRMLVRLLREERDRYAKLERRFYEQGAQLRKAREENGNAVRAHAEDLHNAWRAGARNGYGVALRGRSLTHSLACNPHLLPDDEEE